MFKPGIEQLKKAFSNKGYPIKTGEWELNLIGIRNDNPIPNSFDDTLCVLYTDHYGDGTIVCFSCTTDAGLYYLQHPINAEGCIIMKEGHYEDVYKVGLHRGYKALEQCGNIAYVRDNNKDGILDFNRGKEVTGNFKTNIHHASYPEHSTLVDKWSAGCQVINKGWDDFLELCEQSRLVTGRNRFSYTLLNLKDVKYA